MRDCSDAPDPAVVQRDGVHCGVDHDGSDHIQVSYRDFLGGIRRQEGRRI